MTGNVNVIVEMLLGINPGDGRLLSPLAEYWFPSLGGEVFLTTYIGQNNRIWEVVDSEKLMLTELCIFNSPCWEDAGGGKVRLKND